MYLIKLPISATFQFLISIINRINNYFWIYYQYKVNLNLDSSLLIIFKWYYKLIR